MLHVVHCSPHLHSLTERIAINGEPISREAFDGLAQGNRTHLEQAQTDSNGALTHFEALTALAFKHFQEQGVQLYSKVRRQSRFVLWQPAGGILQSPPASDMPSRSCMKV